MEPITHLITRYKEGDPNAEKELIAQMSPLIKKYAGKIHFMEYTDAMQELYLALLESLDYLNEAYSQAQCLKYMEVCVINRYHSLCRRALSAPEQKSSKNMKWSFVQRQDTMTAGWMSKRIFTLFQRKACAIRSSACSFTMISATRKSQTGSVFPDST